MEAGSSHSGKGYGRAALSQGKVSSRCDAQEDQNIAWRPNDFRRRHALAGKGPTQPPAWVGNGVSRAASDSEANAAAGLVKMLWSLHEDLCAYLFLFVEVNCLSHTASSCRQLHACLWVDSAFWRTYAGPCLTAVTDIASLQAPVLRESFRKWLFHLDGAWTRHFREFVEQSKSSEFGADFTLLLTDARYIASGLMPHDNRCAVSDFARLLCELLAEYNPAQLDERREAEALVAQVERQSDVFPEREVRDIATALDRSIEHAILDQPPEDGDLEAEHLLEPLEDASDEERFPEMEDWSNLDVGGEQPVAPSGTSADLFDAVDRGENVQSFWRDSDD